MAFRGRCMVELKTDLGQLPEIPVEDINSEEILKVQVLYLTKKFCLQNNPKNLNPSCKMVQMFEVVLKGRG